MGTDGAGYPEAFGVKPRGHGKGGYPPLLRVKVLMLQRWYHLSDPQTEEALFDRISFMKFIGLSLTSAKLDSTTICRFRNALSAKELDQKLLAILTSV
ncbi:MAG: hypothetical protein A2527_06790 [Candidatus Lambdaproteobacteria bacterium RIFOXYD2_FULL_50_16]|uniref:Transposase InsH N-terminal domain-containing protein n=1 Tax=Candidatus Lambdaproteobacteria bacterium RIFOXYD2_FULL_50_16 TaxID=1817772 RepID=A0A1F6GBQ1_9PROT|nr:MAG: hypothetical protein A2527_06790 [Candidatus Lambdaproteobacteria bacterium RIFOXYD2_FULL_50_16]